MQHRAAHAGAVAGITLMPLSDTVAMSVALPSTESTSLMDDPSPNEYDTGASAAFRNAVPSRSCWSLRALKTGSPLTSPQLSSRSIRLAKNASGLLEAQPVGESPEVADLTDVFAKNAIGLLVEFKNKDTEREYQLYYNRLMKELYIILGFTAGLFFILYALESVVFAIFRQNVDEGTLGVCVVLIFNSSLMITAAFITRYCPASFVARFQHLYVQDAKGLFQVYVRGSYEVMLYSAVFFATCSFRASLLNSLFIVSLNWLAIVLTDLTVPPSNRLSIMTTYATLSLTAAVAVRDRERRSRRIFLMERLLAQASCMTLERVSSVTVADMLRRRRSGASAVETLGPDPVDPIQSPVSTPTLVARAASVLGRLRAYLQLSWSREDKRLEDRFWRWRHRSMLVEVRVYVCMLIAIDLVGAFTDPMSYCHADGTLRSSPSMCGSRGEISRR
ncbi:hypothetical protein HK101_006833 [Irineochytrium annulatum]|nr:hypothetical protein HK101_006833 [Irineochytrium annulatum]